MASDGDSLTLDQIVQAQVPAWAGPVRYGRARCHFDGVGFWSEGPREAGPVRALLC